MKSIYLTNFYVSGEGLNDDTDNLQAALTYCSNNNFNCVIPENIKLRITKPVFLWGKSGLIGENGAQLLIDITDLTDRYIINLGISAKFTPEKIFTGSIENIIFTPLSGPLDKWMSDGTPIAGRIIQFWRAQNAIVKNNTFELGQYFYTSTAGHNNSLWFNGPFVRKNIDIILNKINAVSDAHGMEGIGIDNAQTISIKNNTINGVGDDLIGVHFCRDVQIKDNDLKGVDGRIFVATSTDIVIDNNKIERVASGIDGLFKKGDSLIYIGYEYPSAIRTPHPENIEITNNRLTYPINSIDEGAAISVQGAINTIIDNNKVFNYSLTVKAHGIWIAPWLDPDISDPDTNFMTYSVIGAQIKNNVMSGKYPLKIVMTGKCIGFNDKIYYKNNIADLEISCPSAAIIE